MFCLWHENTNILLYNQYLSNLFFVKDFLYQYENMIYISHSTLNIVMNNMKIIKITSKTLTKSAAGEMSYKDLQEGGEFYQAGQELKNAAFALESLLNSSLQFDSVHPFSVDQGPYAQLTPMGRLWTTEKNDEYELIIPTMNNEISIKGATEEIANRVYNLAQLGFLQI